jgi:hypothetical protein
MKFRENSLSLAVPVVLFGPASDAGRKFSEESSGTRGTASVHVNHDAVVP